MNAAKLPLLLSLAAAAALAGCSDGLHLPGRKAPFDKTLLESRIDDRFGGRGTCVVILDARTGAELYRYNRAAVCMNPLPPCATFQAPETLIGLDDGAVTPDTVFPWDGKPQRVREWQKPMDLKTAFASSVPWWFGRLAQTIGLDKMQSGLRALDYGDGVVQGPLGSFWMGPANGGQLGVSTRQQAAFLHRLYAGKLPVKPEASAFVQQALVDETRGGSTMSGIAASCPSLSDGSRQVSWWAGRLKGPKTDYAFAVSMEADNDHTLPGEELKTRVKTAFADAGLWPRATD